MRHRVMMVLCASVALLVCGGALLACGDPTSGDSVREEASVSTELSKVAELDSETSYGDPGPDDAAGKTLESETKAPKAAGPGSGAVTAGAGDGVQATAAWGEALGRYAKAGGLDYAGLKADSSGLDGFLAYASKADGTDWSREHRLAFLINTYNAWVARAVLDRYPGLESVIKEEGFFDRQLFEVQGQKMTLNQLERSALDLDEPRVHFAVVCASTGCPDLREELFEASRLEQQLQEQTQKFLADESKGLRYDGAKKQLWLSSIFDWYKQDFDGDVVAWLLPQVPAALAKDLQQAKPSVSFLDYDWSPNDRK